MRTKVHEIPGKVLLEWDSIANVMITHWFSYYVTLDEYKEAIFIKGNNKVKLHNVKTWIIDSSKAKGVFTKDIQNFIKTEVLPANAQSGMKYFITINSESALTNMNVRMYSVSADSNGLQTVKAHSIEGALEWLREEQLHQNKS